MMEFIGIEVLCPGKLVVMEKGTVTFCHEKFYV